MKRYLLFLVVVLVLMPVGCQRKSNEANARKLAITNTYLESAARDLLGSEVQVLRLAEPGTCPGHFDMRPSQMSEMRSCRALLRFDFQRSLDGKVSPAATNHFQVVEVTLRNGLCVPESYLAACRQLADAFVALGWRLRPEADTKLKGVSERIAAMADWAREEIQKAGLANRPVLASGRQKDFCEWLGLKVVASFQSADISSVSEIERAIETGQLAGVKIIVANLPEGRRTADALAERLGANVVVFDNFPMVKEGRLSFDEMLTGNVKALIKTAGP
jgi:ABC-type Zn uptake system ZnuABC Zn-binding protein ZnuA